MQKKGYSISTKNVSKWLVLLFISILLTFIYGKIYVLIFKDTPRKAMLRNKIAEMNFKYDLLIDEIKDNDDILNDISQRDNNMYRSVLGLNGIVNLNDNVVDTSKLAIINKADNALLNFQKKLYSQLNSFGEVYAMATNSEQMAKCMPAIPPINLQSVKFSSNFGIRRDPIFGDLRQHNGVDFSGQLGTPVYSTGDGVVLSINFSFSGYGNEIKIDHGFGYITRYAHLSRIYARPGMKIKRGDKIGLLGNTGKSTGPHLHYEVIYRGQAIDPKKFFTLDLGSNYDEMIVNNTER